MNIIVIINGVDATEACILNQTRINYDISRRISTAQITVAGTAAGQAPRYDAANYDIDRYGVEIRELFPVTILDGRDGVTKLFEGYVFNITLEQTDGEMFPVFYHCDLNDHAAWLDRSVCWGGIDIPMPSNDQTIIQTCGINFCPYLNFADVAQLVPVIMNYDWRSKTVRQVLDDMATLSGGEWLVDYSGFVHYRAASAAPLAPFSLSTSPDNITSFPVRVDGYKRDFQNPVNSVIVRGALDTLSGLPIEASYSDPVSISQFGPFSAAIVDDQITAYEDAELRARSTVVKYAYPLESGGFTIWKDDLKAGQRVNIREDALNIDGEYIIRSLNMAWEDQSLVRYDAQFGASQPDLETYLRLLDQRARWRTSKPTAGSAGPVAPGSVTDASIASGGLSAAVIGSVNASVIQGTITAGQIGSVNATSILGQLTAGQIGSVNAVSIIGAIDAGQIGSVNSGAIQGVITAGQIGSINAAVIQGVVVSDQLADGILDDLAKYTDALRPVRMIAIGDPWPPGMPDDNFPPNSYFFYEPDGYFYQVTPDGLSWINRGANPDTLPGIFKFHSIGAINAKNIMGLIIAAQIENITAGQIVGQIQAGQIGSVQASTIQGQITAAQIASVNATAIQGSISAGQITSIDASKITGQIQASQIASIDATDIQGTIQAGQIGSINAATITVGTLKDSQIADINGGKIWAGSISSEQLNTYAINVGGGEKKPGRINVYRLLKDIWGNPIGTEMTAQIGTLDTGQYGGWFRQFGVGGVNYNDARLRTDEGGNAYITNANFTITSSGYTMKATPVDFDSSYGSLMLEISGSGDSTRLVSRGIVVYNGTTMTGALTRDPANASNVQLVLYNDVRGFGVLADGYSGVLRVSRRYDVGGSPGRTVTITVALPGGGSTVLNFVGGILVP